MAIQKGDFVEIEYTGKLPEGMIFDTTDEKIAKDNGLYDEKANYGPTIICIGQNQIVKGLDDDLVGKEINKEYKADLKPEDAFGKKSAKLIQLLPASKFKKQNITPQPGLQVQVDNQFGTIKTATGGRVMVDFNHPLSGKDLSYTYKVNRILDDNAEKVKEYLKTALRMKAEVTKEEETYVIKSETELPKEITGEIEKKLKEVIGDYKYRFDKNK